MEENNLNIIRNVKTMHPLKFMELIVWFVISFAVAWRPWIYLFTYPYKIFDVYYEFLFGLFFVLFPFLFRLIFGYFPLEYVRRQRNYKMAIQLEKSLQSEIGLEDEIAQKKSEQTGYVDDELSTLENYIKQSRKISEKIYQRSGVYLLIGCLIAFAGVLFFYFQNPTILIHASDIDKLQKVDIKPQFDFSETLFQYLPRLGTLIFVEAIAFFFLRQYRTNIEEFRYFEAIKRQRENQ